MNAFRQRSREVARSGTLAWMAAVAVLVLGACYGYPDSSERLDDDIVFTSYSDKADFGSYKTFSIAPEVHLVVVKEDGSVESKNLDAASSAALVSQVVTNMVQRGYTQVDSSLKPSLGISLTAVNGRVDGVVSGGYYGGYYGYYWGYPGWGYYYPYPVAYSYQTGSLIIDMADLKGAASTLPLDAGGVVGADGGLTPGGLPVVWTAAAYRAGVDIEHISPAGVKAAQQAIDQAFKQSPYLRSN
jgi:uncharacterized protein DUF4136